MFDNTNPYTIRIEEMNGQKRYFVAFVDGQGIFREAEVSYEVYAQFCRFVKYRALFYALPTLNTSLCLAAT
ncbi:hypothetical protein [Blautia sp. An249]|uniref:hypothetical protein n=1 Tax=Blautia sp. An249 TaxID=1965603 RepID=UPI001122315C|nr:hypothetical protein [Blautia sp. An249]